MFRMAVAVLRHPSVWWEGLRAMMSMRASSGAFSNEYLLWRTATVYGDSHTPIPARDLVDFLAWRGRQRRLSG